MNSFLFFRSSLKINFRISLISKNSVYMTEPKSLCNFLWGLKRMEKNTCRLWQFPSPSHRERKLFQVCSYWFLPCETKATLCQTTCVKEFSAVFPVLIIPKPARSLVWTFKWFLSYGLFGICLRAWQFFFPSKLGLFWRDPQPSNKGKTPIFFMLDGSPLYTNLVQSEIIWNEFCYIITSCSCS